MSSEPKIFERNFWLIPGYNNLGDTQDKLIIESCPTPIPEVTGLLQVQG